MADTKISGLSAVTDVQTTDEFVLARAGTTKKITGASLESEISGGGAVVLINDIDLTSTQAFTSIPGTYNDLVLKIIGRGAAAAATVIPNLRFNSDSGANYETNLINAGNNTITSGAAAGHTEAVLSVFPAATAVANRAGIALIEIPEYAGAFHKILRSECHTIYDTAAANYVTQIRGIQWRNTAAITQIDIVLSSGGWASGSVARLYGVT